MSDDVDSFITLEDLKGICRRHAKPLILSGLCGAFLCMSFFLTKPPIYTVEAVFQEKARANSIGNQAGIATLVFGGKDLSSMSSTGLLLSRNMIGRAIESSGLQITRYYSSKLSRKFQLIAENVNKEDLKAFQFENVKFEGENPCLFTVKFLNEKKFIVRCQEVDTQGCLGEPLGLLGLNFSIVSTPKKLQIGKTYKFVISPLGDAIDRIEKQVEIKPAKQSRSMQSLVINSQDQRQGERFLKAWVKLYLSRTQAENAKLATSQLDYLSYRKRALFNELDEEIEQGESYLRELINNNLAVSGADLSGLLNKRAKIVEDLFEIKQEEQLLVKGGIEYFSDADGIYTADLARLNALKMQRNKLWLNKLCFGKTEELQLEFNKDALASINQGRARLHTFENSILTALKKANVKPSQALKRQTHALKEILESERIANEERLLLNVGELKELEGVTLETAQSLFLKYSSLRDNTISYLEDLKQLQDRLKSESNVGAIFAFRHAIPDASLAEELVRLHHQISDADNLLEREAKRLKLRFSTVKEMLLSQINQLLDCNRQKVRTLTEQMRRTNEYVLDASNREILTLEKNLSQKAHLVQEKLQMTREFMEEELMQLDKRMLGVPRLISNEKRLEFHLTVTQKMLEGITKLIDQKILEKNLELAASGLIDEPFLRKAPSNRSPLIFAAVGGFTGVSITFGILLLLTLLQGMPINVSQLRLRHLHAFSLKGSSTLDSLREIIAKMEQVSVWIAGNGPDLIPELTKLLSMQDEKVVVLDFDPYSIRQGDEKGFVDVVLGDIETLPIKREKCFDRVCAGGNPAFLPEIIKRPGFILLLKKLQSKYDRVVLRTKALPATFEARMLLDFADTATVFINKELMEDLEPYISRGKEKVTFIVYNE